jgi:predicted ferric reductase
MNEQLAWYLARSSGIVSLVLAACALVLGLLLSTRALKPHDRPAWLLAMHRWVSSLLIVGTAGHVVALVADNYVTIGWVEILVPMTSSYRPLAVSLGVVAMYLLALVHVSSVLMKRLSKSTWRRLHALSPLLVWCAVLHGALAGTDAANPVYQAIVWLLISACVAAGLFRVVLGRSADRARQRAGTATADSRAPA